MNNLSTKGKLSILIIISSITLLILGIFSVVNLKKVNEGLETVYNDRIIPLEQLKKVADAYAINIVDTTHKTRNENISFKRCIKNINNAQNTIKEQWTSYMSSKLTKKEARLADEAKLLIDKGDKIAVQIKNACNNKNLELLSKISIETLYPQIDPIGDKIDKLIKLQLKVAKKETLLSNDIYKTSKITTIILIAIGLIIIFTFAYLIITDILKKLDLFKNGLNLFFSYLNKEKNTVESIKINSKDEFGQMAYLINNNIEKTKISLEEDKELIQNVIKVLGEFEQGDLSQRIDIDVKNPVLKQLKNVLNEMATILETNIDIILNTLNEYTNYNYLNKVSTKSLKKHLLRLANGVNSLGEATTTMLIENKTNGLTLGKSSKQLLNKVDIVNESSTDAASSLEETAAAIEEITSNIRNNTENIDKMSKFSSEVIKSATKGEELAKSTVSSMDEINVQTNSIAEAITIIDQIAFQTNILSLNAAVEAATAGEAGKGFAVVAQEVRNLASRSAEAAKEIKELVENATIKADTGKNIATSMIEGYKELNNNISHSNELILDIENASKEQLLGIEQINGAINQLDQQTQKNTMVASQTHEIASFTNNIADVILKKADEKEFEGKAEVKAEEIKTLDNEFN